MEKTIQHVEKWKGYVPKDDNPYEKEMVSYRITTTDGNQYVSWRWEDDSELKPYSKYLFKETGTKLFSFFNEPKREYISVKVGDEIPVQKNKQVITDTPTLFDQESPVESTKIIQTDDTVEYHKLAMEYLWRIDKLDLISLNKLAPHMKSVCDGTITKDKLGKLNLEFYNDRM